MRTKIGSLAAACAMALLGLAQAAAESIPADVARVDWIDNRHEHAVIDDQSFTLAPGVVIHGSSGLLSRASLREGMKIRFRTTTGSPPAVVEIWIVK